MYHVFQEVVKKPLSNLYKKIALNPISLKFAKDLKLEMKLEGYFVNCNNIDKNYTFEIICLDGRMVPIITHNPRKK